MINTLLAAALLTSPPPPVDFDLCVSKPQPVSKQEPVAQSAFDLEARRAIDVTAARVDTVEDQLKKVQRQLQELKSKQAQAVKAAKAIPTGPATLAFFGASWCAPCHHMEPIIADLEAKGYRIQRVDYDKNKDWVKRFDVTSVPTMVVFTPDGDELDRIEGATTEERITSIKGFYPTEPARPEPSVVEAPIQLSPPAFPARQFIPTVPTVPMMPMAPVQPQFRPTFTPFRGGGFQMFRGGGVNCGPGGCH